MPETFLHGVEVLEIDAGPRPVQTVRSSVIGLIGTAPGAAAEVKSQLATGVVATNNAQTWTSKRAGTLGDKISLTIVKPSSNNAELAITVDGAAITVSLATSAGAAATTTATQLATAIAAHAEANALVGVANTGASTGAGVVAVLGKTFLSGGVDEAFPLNTPVVIAGSRLVAAGLGDAGTLPGAVDRIFDQAGAVIVVVRVAEGEDEADTLANIVGGVNSGTGAYEGVHCFLGAESGVGLVPRILIAPGWTHQRDATANPVVAELIGIADRLRAVVIADGPNSTDADALAYAADFGSKRVYMHDPFDKVMDADGQIVEVPASARIAGQIAKSDNERGFWWSPSNQVANGIVGTARPIDFALGDPNARANLLNEAGVATTIRQDGFRLWGNRTLSADPKWIFLSVVRTADLINDSLLRAHLWAVDRNITKTYVDDVLESVRAYLRQLTTIGAILGGDCWADPDLNTPENIALGKIFFDFDFSPAFPAEHVTFRSRMVNDYLVEIF